MLNRTPLISCRATRFEVTLAFLLQQAAWLYERQLVQVRAQMRKVGASKGSNASPIPGSITESGGEAMRRTGSGGPGPRVPSSLSTRKDSPIPKNETSIPTPSGRAMAPPFSRTSSGGTIHSRNLPPQNSPRLAQAILNRRSISPPPRTRTVEPQPDSPSSPEESSSESSSDSGPAQSRLIRRPPRFTSQAHGQSEDGDDDDDGSAFMPFAAAGGDSNTHHDPSETLREDPRDATRRIPTRKGTDISHQSQTSDSSTSSAAPVSRLPTTKDLPQRSRPTGPLSPRRTAELAGRSSGGKGKGVGRHDSDGTPSMGSSFSDLDDASVTQSALEEALASNMQAGGGMASRMSSLSQALRSKYL
ncbi:hypothetical protein PVAG01_08864 [Phlyctema vagabunda]|uniref:Autophagy-related protein 29 n=1 Tax=Phlyctema vagabunda TaxID=108571 RepID=A0ABR4PAQ1_9HELO